MANLTNSAKLIEEMSKKANRTELPEVNDSTVNFTVNGNTGSQSMTTNQPNNSTVNLTVTKATVGLGNVDNTSDANKPISNATKAALDLKADKSDLSSVYKYKGSVASYSNLPSTGLTAGDVYNVADSGMNYAWTGSAWDALGSTIDLSNYLAKNNTTSFTPTGDYNPATKKYVDDNKTEYNAGEGIEIGNDYSAMQGPAPDGFHVPLNIEWQAVYDVWTALDGGSSDGTNFGTALKLPFAGYRFFNSSNVDGQGIRGFYWSSSRRNASTAHRLFFNSTALNPQSYDNRAGGFSVRCFKNSPVVPTSSWTKLYGTSIEAGGIFWSITDGLISLSSNGQNWITIADKNLGATTVWNSGDTLSEANCGKYYQRGNNYGFPRTGTIANQSTTQVDASNYGPGNYYSSDTFIKYSGRWDTTDNGNLWGGVTGVVSNAITNTGVLSVNGETGDVTIQTGGNYTAGNGIDITNDEIGLDGTYEGIGEGDDYSAMQGPAPSGFHVPLTTEWQAVYDVWTALGGGSSDGTNFGIALKLPFAGYRDDYANVIDQDSYGHYWSSSRYDTDSAYSLYFDSTALDPESCLDRAYGFSVRCFKNSPVVPTSSWTKLYGTSIESGGIFWSSADGLISLSSDGTTWITIADKNLGATQVWNSGDTLSEANCGKYYQWGNNYGFPRTGTIANQSTTQVDASSYGPGNYYSSDTFIKYSGRWDTTDNGNLWGGVTGIEPIIISGNLVVGDKLYKIVTSTSAPASGTASNVITIVTD